MNALNMQMKLQKKCWKRWRKKESRITNNIIPWNVHVRLCYGLRSVFCALDHLDRSIGLDSASTPPFTPFFLIWTDEKFFFWSSKLTEREFIFDGTSVRFFASSKLKFSNKVQKLSKFARKSTKFRKLIKTTNF